MEAVLQMELFPKANKRDIQQAKEHLENYRLMHRNLQIYSEKLILSSEERALLEYAKRLLPEIDTAFKLIMDEEVNKILTHRYITVGKHKYTIAKYVSNTSISTINRRIDAGIRTIANCLKLSGVLYIELKEFRR
ncbi:hypothetical protein [Paenibacillus gallinarum]|uniref:Transcriptional regulator n=1 Tax=Paenibacillus gallinarum TaxID=2762232 RepID=A0ABR8SW71_9BACL|nr:hypothetical protein [Paenibacillus gallinarum]MBD7967743.1 hypothetical protein [Paenibacillus gallinarum]